MSGGRVAVGAIGLGLVAVGMSMAVGSCYDRNFGDLKGAFEKANACEAKLKLDQSCTLEEQKAAVAYKDSEKKTLEGALWMNIGLDLLDALKR